MKAVHQAPEGVSDEARRAYDTRVAAKELRASGAFEYVELNTWKHASQVAYGGWPPNDEYLSRQPHYSLIDLPAAFDALASLSPRPTYVPIVAVVDSGIVADHPDLARMLVPGYDFISIPSISGDGDGIDANPNDEAGSGGSFHGTHVAGTIAAEAFNSRGVIGVAPMARIMPVRVLGVGGGTLFDITQGIRFAAGLSNSSNTLPARRADVINLSLGGSDACSSAEADVFAAVRQQGVIVVAATGNEAAPVGSPANCGNVIAVSAVSYDLRLATYSNSGPQTAVTAPGGDQSRNSPAGADLIVSTYAAFQGGVRRAAYAGLQGTSMATPHVAGVMALMRAVNPSLTPAQVDTLLASGALTQELGAAGRDSSFGYGLINALKAVQAAAGSGTTPTPVPDLPTLAVEPTTLDFGTSLTELGVTVTRINGSTVTPDRYATSAIDANAVIVAVPAGTPNPDAGPYRYVVSVDRAKLAPGENVVRVEIGTATQRVGFDVSVAQRTSVPVGQLGVGPVYVLAVDVNSLANVGQADVTTVGLVYAYSIAGITAPQIYMVAGTDTDNDGYICGASEPCGLFPVLGGQPTVLELSAGSRSGINFDLVSGGASAASTSFAQGAAAPARGFRRVMP
jgi:serine protease